MINRRNAVTPRSGVKEMHLETCILSNNAASNDPPWPQLEGSPVTPQVGVVLRLFKLKINDPFIDFLGIRMKNLSAWNIDQERSANNFRWPRYISNIDHERNATNFRSPRYISIWLAFIHSGPLATWYMINIHTWPLATCDHTPRQPPWPPVPGSQMTPHQGVTTRREGGWHYTIYLMRRPAPLYWPGVERLKIRRIMAAPVPAESSEYIGIKRITNKFEIANCKRASIMHCATVLRSTRNAHNEIWCYKNANF